MCVRECVRKSEKSVMSEGVVNGWNGCSFIGASIDVCVSGIGFADVGVGVCYD